jgi:hypothetical protein
LIAEEEKQANQSQENDEHDPDEGPRGEEVHDCVPFWRQSINGRHDTLKEPAKAESSLSHGADSRRV